MARIGIIGCGIIGSSWAATWAAAGHELLVRDAALSADEIRARIEQINTDSGFPPLRDDALQIANGLEDFAQGVDYIQESIVENLEAKRALYAQLDAICAPGTILASSSSALSASRIGGDLPGARRIIVAHPATPPHVMPAVEVVPSPHTDPEVFRRTWDLLEGAGQVPIHVLREVEGFAMNRMQAVLIFSMLEMIEDGIVTPEGADAIIRESFGMRWSILGPLEGVHLNAPGGVQDYFTRYRPLFEGLAPPGTDVATLLSDSRLAQLQAYAVQQTPVSRLPARRGWRDARLIEMKRWKQKEAWNG